MALYYFDIAGGVVSQDRIGRDVRDPLDLRRQALREAAEVALRVSGRGMEAEVIVTVRDATGAVCLKVRLLSQVDVP